MSFEEDLEKGQEYQDFIADLLWKELHIPLIQYVSKKYQMNKGESVNGIEVKYDISSQKTGNLYFELSCQNKEGEWYGSGINKDDNTWLWVIGNYEEIFIFGKKQLQNMAKSGKFKEVRTNSKITVCPTKGMLLSLKDAKHYCIKYFNLEEK